MCCLTRDRGCKLTRSRSCWTTKSTTSICRSWCQHTTKSIAYPQWWMKPFPYFSLFLSFLNSITLVLAKKNKGRETFQKGRNTYCKWRVKRPNRGNDQEVYRAIHWCHINQRAEFAAKPGQGGCRQICTIIHSVTRVRDLCSQGATSYCSQMPMEPPTSTRLRRWLSGARKTSKTGCHVR